MAQAERSPWQITWSVWHAMFMREVLARTMVNRFSWFWMLAEPIAYVVIMVWVRELLGRIRFIIGADFIPWLIVGLTTFFLWREAVIRSLGAVSANQGLFAYRQVHPVDPVLVRNILEGLLKTVVLMLLIIGASFLGYDVVPADPLGAVAAWLGMWLLGLGFGLMASVGATLVDEIDMVVRLAMLPTFLLTGVIIPLHAVPHSVLEYLLYNPMLHGVEGIRIAFFDGYKSLNGIDPFYLWKWNLVTIALGLALHMRFATRLKAK
ncbi:MAG: ABC transporter permease [Pseudomonadota bacterium]